MREPIRVKLDLSYQDAQILRTVLEGRGYPHLLEQVNDAHEKSVAFRFWYLIKQDFKCGNWRSMFYRFKNFREIRSKYR